MLSTITYFSNATGPEKQSTYVILGEKAKAQLIRDSKNYIELCITELQRNPLNYTQVSLFCFFVPYIIGEESFLLFVWIYVNVNSKLISCCKSSIESSKLSIKENVVNARSAVKIYSSGDSGQQGFPGFRSCNVRP